ncbi:MAG: UDP-N-acetylmuramate--L-alanine ligase, partial [Synechococcaceae cyanobacterium RM1_1_27]|nr:UDP-N-acetylmuramate--L-alanine ligase [Synechococcaceae cyanobacterium RM1_1_27]
METQAFYHFVGIGGVGMSALAHIFAKLGCRVSGSDVAPSLRTRRLQELGVTIFTGPSGSSSGR